MLQRRGVEEWVIVGDNFFLPQLTVEMAFIVSFDSSFSSAFVNYLEDILLVNDYRSVLLARSKP